MFFLSDHHFDHKNICKYENRPFNNIAQMNESLITLWNDNISVSHTVFYLGDFSLGQYPEDYESILIKLNYKNIIWIKGNHDVSIKKLNKLERVFANKRISIDIPDIGEVLLTHVPDYEHNFNLNIHGHIHSRENLVIYHKNNRLFFHVGVDMNNFKPWHIDNIVKIYKKFKRGGVK